MTDLYLPTAEAQSLTVYGFRDKYTWYSVQTSLFPILSFFSADS